MTDFPLDEIRREVGAIEAAFKKIQHAVNRWDAERRDQARCSYMRNSNMRCLLNAEHEGKHCRPCIDRGAHRAHRDEDATSFVNCSGRSFDLT